VDDDEEDDDDTEEVEESDEDESNGSTKDDIPLFSFEKFKKRIFYDVENRILDDLELAEHGLGKG
jgi:hypothetical protein